MWTYRVVRREVEGEDEYSIYEFYPPREGEDSLGAISSVAPYGNTVEALQQDLKWMLMALSQPVLEYDDFREKEESDAILSEETCNY